MIVRITSEGSAALKRTTGRKVSLYRFLARAELQVACRGCELLIVEEQQHAPMNKISLCFTFFSGRADSSLSPSTASSSRFRFLLLGEAAAAPPSAPSPSARFFPFPFFVFPAPAPSAATSRSAASPASAGATAAGSLDSLPPFPASAPRLPARSSEGPGWACSSAACSSMSS